MLLAACLAVAAVSTAAYWVVLIHQPPVPRAAPPGRGAQDARVDRMVKEILDRPLFSSDRKPPPPEDLEVPQPPPVLQSRLTGITISPASRQAVFTAEGKNILVREGDAIDGFKVKRIDAGRVILASSFGEQVLQPSRGIGPTVRNTKVVEMGKFDPDK